MTSPSAFGNVAIIPSLAIFRGLSAAGLPPVVFLQGTTTPLDGGQAFYEVSLTDKTTADTGTGVVVDGGGYRWFAVTDITISQIVAALTNNGTTPGLDPLSSQGADIASASTTDLSTATGNAVNITGSVTITALGTLGAGKFRFVKFTGALVLTYNATSLILPGQANITSAAGDTALFMSLGSGNWQCIVYTPLAGGSTGVLPIPEGGTGKTTSVTAFDALSAQGTTIPSATTTPIGAATGPYVIVSGTTTITAFDTIAAGTRRTVTFSGILTLTNNNTSLILPGSANITTAVNDTAEFISLGSGNWLCVSYTTANGLPLRTVTVAKGGTGATTSVAGFNALQAKGADIASATTTDLSTATGPFVNITGTTTITALGTVAAGTQVLLRFTGALLLTYNASSLILPGAANITTVAGDAALMESLGSGNWRCLNYSRFSGLAVVSKPPTLTVFANSAASGTYTPPSGMTAVIVEVRGAGGGGGGVSNNAGYLAGAGGAEGGYSRRRLTAAQVGASQTVTVGAGGAAGSTSGGAGGTGGTTSFGALLQATGGGGGSGTVATGAISGNNGGVGSSGDINLTGEGSGFGLGITVSTLAVGGFGGGSGGQTGRATTGAGFNASSGGGGSGAVSLGATTANTGGIGGDGWVIITEFYD